MNNHAALYHHVSSLQPQRRIVRGIDMFLHILGTMMADTISRRWLPAWTSEDNLPVLYSCSSNVFNLPVANHIDNRAHTVSLDVHCVHEHLFSCSLLQKLLIYCTYCRFSVSLWVHESALYIRPIAAWVTKLWHINTLQESHTFKLILVECY